MFPPRTERRRSHTFTEGVFEEVIANHLQTTSQQQQQQKNDLSRQRSLGGSPETRNKETRSPILLHLHKKFFSHGSSSFRFFGYL